MNSGPLSERINAGEPCIMNRSVRASITFVDLALHDLRHEAISRMFDRGMKIHNVMAVSGHRTVNQLFRYVQINNIL
ncbi:MAG: tyrosine-type recombinase/integrase [Paracoccaceae bacterium]